MRDIIGAKSKNFIPDGKRDRDPMDVSDIVSRTSKGPLIGLDLDVAAG